MFRTKSLREETDADGTSSATLFEIGESRPVSHPRGLKSSDWLYVSVLMLLAFVLRLFLLRYNEALDGDGVWYATLGHSLIAGNIKGGLSAYWPPLYPFLIGVRSE